MIATTARRYSLDEYRAIAETSEEKCEYHDGEIITMTGGTATHSRISRNVVNFLDNNLEDTNFEAFNSDLRIWIPKYRCGVYPDAMVVDSQLQFHDGREDEILNPLLIIEVLSPSTQKYDRTDKFEMYRSIPSLCEYLLIRQDRPFVERYTKQLNGWLFSDFNGLEDSISLESIKIELAMTKIYRGIIF
ncbi:Uma2 family endonuclease [Pseudanabaena mucicola]|uniref:Uma2 family endonuclease n=1 Tax=Pseudanabaena mucicola FACHB-723 TaxID=2692860 RepID=A0ABR7ZV17_9CYAN|nr:Uma2 family endonuclease [Pseudanabaena mucicola]MBD2187637.1 Uma2 family endonuclease [Pseudanabaena mucicola FACHB-723]